MGYTTSSGYSDLDGSCEISGNDCTSYTSTSKGQTVTPRNIGSGSNLIFQVTFPPDTHPYTITASPRSTKAGGGYSGHASHGQKRTDEPWTATATQVDPVEDSY